MQTQRYLYQYMSYSMVCGTAKGKEQTMKKVYDRFADEYIDESEKNPYAPPERYTEITEEVLVENAARWFLTALKRLLDEEADHKTEQNERSSE